MMNENPAASSTGTYTWDDFVRDDRPDRFFCRICNAVWRHKRGRQGYNRCPRCGTIYAAANLIHLSNDPRRIKLLDFGVPVSVQTTQLVSNDRPTELWWRFWRQERNQTLLREQGLRLEPVGDGAWRVRT